MTTRHEFNDPISGTTMVLVLGDEKSRPYDGTHGVEHPGCPRLADVSPDLDAFFCPMCSMSGRISGAWFMELWTGESIAIEGCEHLSATGVDQAEGPAKVWQCDVCGWRFRSITDGGITVQIGLGEVED